MRDRHAQLSISAGLITAFGKSPAQGLETQGYGLLGAGIPHVAAVISALCVYELVKQ